MNLLSPLFVRLLVCASILDFGLAHPGEDHSHVKREADELSHHARRDASSLSKCADSNAAQLMKRENLARRHATAKALREKRGINAAPFSKRDLASLQAFEAINHDHTGVITSQDPSKLFGANTSCILAPEVTIGPYYVLGEMVRSDLTEGQSGVPIHLEMQFINTKTCEPVPNLLVDIWNTNSTGTYSGVAGEGGLQTTFMRGLQKSASNGVVQFDTLFPGHYMGRSIHTHLAVHTNATQLSNGSFTGGTVSHIGQVFYGEAISAAVQKQSPYNTNTVERLTNDEDTIAQAQADNNHDPLVQYVQLNANNLADGLFAWIEIGIDPTANHTDQAGYAAVWAADGGHASNNTFRPGGDGMPNGGPPGRANATATSSGRPAMVSTSGAGSLARRNWLRFW